MFFHETKDAICLSFIEQRALGFYVDITNSLTTTGFTLYVLYHVLVWLISLDYNTIPVLARKYCSLFKIDLLRQCWNVALGKILYLMPSREDNNTTRTTAEATCVEPSMENVFNQLAAVNTTLAAVQEHQHIMKAQFDSSTSLAEDMYEKLFRSHMKKHEMLNNASVGDLGIERPNDGGEEQNSESSRKYYMAIINDVPDFNQASQTEQDQPEQADDDSDPNCYCPCCRESRTVTNTAFRANETHQAKQQMDDESKSNCSCEFCREQREDEDAATPGSDATANDGSN